MSTFVSAAVFCGCRTKTPQNPDDTIEQPENPENPEEPENPDNPEEPEEPEKPETKVTFNGAGDTQVLQGRFFDYLNGVTAVSKSGEDLTDKITVDGEVNTSKAGEYALTYSAEDKDGNKGEAVRKITVVKNEAIGKDKLIPVYGVSEGNYNIANGCESYSGTASKTDTAYAFDNDLSTRWESEWTEDITLTVDLRAKLKVEQVKLYWEAAYATDFSLLVSDDGAEWEKVAFETGQTLTGNRINEIDLDGVSCRYLRLHCEKRAMPAYGYSLFEFEVLGPKGTVIPKDEYPDWFDAKNQNSPDWKIADSQWIKLDLGAEKSVDTMRLAFKNNLTPFKYRILYAGSDGVYKEINIRNLPYSADTFSFANGNSNEKVTLLARYFKIELSERRFYSFSYRITEVNFRLGETAVPVTSTEVSSYKEGCGAEFLTDGNDNTFWENDNGNTYLTVDLKESKKIGRIDLYWRGDDGGKGKYYDLQISGDGVNYTTVFRQLHGDTALQSVYLYESARYIRIIDMQSPSDERSMLEGMVVHSQYPVSSGEGKIEYDVNTQFPERKVEQTKNGSYVTGVTDFPSARLIAYLDESLRGKPVPSNDWWQGLLIRDKGYNMFMNPLTATFTGGGLWLTNHGEGYFDGFVPGNGSQTVNNGVRDIAVGYEGIGDSSKVRVTGYSDYGITAVMTDDKNVDKMTVFLSQGSLYAYCLFAEPEKVKLSYANLLGVYDLNGNAILTDGADYKGDGIVVKVKTHSSYESGVRKYKDTSGAVRENAPLYEERYYVISVPQGTCFKLGEKGISVKMINGNYLSIGAVSQKNTVKENEASSAAFPKAEIDILHSHGYAFIIDTSCTYSFESETNVVTTSFNVRTQLMRKGFSNEAYCAYLPHHISKSTYTGGYVYKSIRGDCRSYAGNSFTTKDTFYGVVPTFAEPDDGGYSTQVLYEQLLLVYKNNDRDGEPVGSYLISGDPYWQGKNLHPMAMAALASDQIGATDLRDKFLDKIEYILTDWFTYDPVADEKTGAYFYYDGEWGTLYYKNSEFGAGVNLADHYFTYGYYTLAAGVLASYRPQFAEDWGDMIELLIRDYMNPDRDDDMFPYMRNFDMFAGHGWAGGYADNDGGNNQESAGEALNSWVGAYLYATATGNEKIRLAAIYGYTTELNAIKHYWFNYFNDFAESYCYGVAGQVYGGSNFYGTFFNGEPLYMYGIHLIPGEEYLTSYALNETEREKLEGLLDRMREEQAMWDTEEAHKVIYAWQHIFIPITAIYDADEALSWYDEVLSSQGNVGNTSEQFNVYWLIHGMKSAGVRTTDIWAENGATATVYEKNGAYNAICWNPTQKPLKIVFRNLQGVTGYAIVPPSSLVTCNPERNTEEFESFNGVNNFTLGGFAESENASAEEGKLTLDSGSATYLLSFGSEASYYSVKINGNLNGVKLYVDGVQTSLTQTASGVESEPVLLSFKRKIKISADEAVINSLTFEKLKLKKAQLDVASVTATSVLGNNSPQNIFDGVMDGTHRWESEHGIDGVTVNIELAAPVTVYQMKIYWEGASASEYKVYFSETGEDGGWTEVYHGKSSQGARTDTIALSEPMSAKYIKIECISRVTNYGYSIYETEIYNFD